MTTRRNRKEEIRNQVRAVVFLALSALAFAALSFPGQTGQVGNLLNSFMRILTGDMAMVIPLALAIVSLKTLLPARIGKKKQRAAGLILFLVILLVWAHMNLMLQRIEVLAEERGLVRAALRLGYEKQGGGIIGGLVAAILYVLFKDIGSYIVIVAAALISFLLVTDYSLLNVLRTALLALGFAGRLFLKGVKGFGSLFSFLFQGTGMEKDDENKPETRVKKTAKKENGFLELQAAGQNAAARPEMAVPVQPALFEAEDLAAREKVQKSAKKVAAEQDPLVVEAGERKPYQKPDRDYSLPPLTLLGQVPRLKDSQQQRSIAERANILEKTLESFGVRVKVSDVQAGPTVTRFEIQPETGVKVSRIVALADDLALNLAAPDVRIEAPIPGKAAVGIEVPNKVIAPVYLREVLEDKQFQNSTSPLTIAIGKDIAGNPVVADLMKMPHLLIAGSTGSGKSVCINVLISSILFKATPDEVKFLMIDPKVVELSTFNGIPHLLAPVVTEPKKASQALKNMVKEMGRRYELFAKANVREINRYNEKMREQQMEAEVLPFIVVIIDELADLMMVAAADVEDSIARLAQMSRAAGIHLVIATQRPSVDVITGVIKANITSRIAFAVSSQADSRTILDMGGAEKLLGRGDMLFHPIGTPKPFRVQGAFINERELNALLDFLREQGEPDFSEEMLHEEKEDDEWYEEDELFPEAVMLVAEAQTASISMLQRRLRIGYTRAARLIDDMERKGYVGRFEGSKAREVLISPEQAARLLGERSDT